MATFGNLTLYLMTLIVTLFAMTVGQSLSGWGEPRRLIGSSSDDKLEVDKTTLAMLDKITDPVVVVSIVGLYRSGKSYLLNRLAGRTNGFALGSTIQSKTKGIWVWCVRHPKKPDSVLLLLDTEGLGDVEKGNKDHDTWIFTLALLLSSTLVYNSFSTIDQRAIDDLHLVTQISDRIKIKSQSNSDDESQEYDLFFPSFIWALRDFTLDLEMDGKTITEDEYLEHALQLKKGTGKKISDYNLPRECIRSYFPDRKCFTFVKPVGDDDALRKLESVSDSEIKPKFLEQTRKFVEHVLKSGKVKKINGSKITGKVLGGLASYYVEAIQSGAVPCIESAVVTIAKVENERAIKEALELYEKCFLSKVTFPAETTLGEFHQLCEEESSKYFSKLSTFDFEQIYYQRMMEQLLIRYRKFVEENEATSRQKCNSILDSFHQSIREAVNDGKYICSGGYEQYKKDMDKLLQKYRYTPGKGIMSGEVLNDFMKRQESTSLSILRADKKLTEEGRRAEEEMRKKEEMEREKMAAEEETRIKDKLLESLKRSYDEHLKRLEEKIKEDHENLKQEYEESLEKNKREMSILMEKGFTEKAKHLTEHVNSLQRIIEELKNTNILEFVVNGVASFFKNLFS